MAAVRFGNMLKSSWNAKNAVWLLLSVLAIGLDQWTKVLATHYLVYKQSVAVLPFLNWTLLYNYGAAFSVLSDAGGWQRWFFTGLAGLVSVVLVVWLLRLPKNTPVLAAAIALVLGGALGNVIDRLTLGYVIDFIHVFYQDHHFPAFNIADSAITLGTILLIVDTFFLEKHRLADQQGQDKA
jgi:signal peptidase II